MGTNIRKNDSSTAFESIFLNGFGVSVSIHKPFVFHFSIT